MWWKPVAMCSALWTAIAASLVGVSPAEAVPEVSTRAAPGARLVAVAMTSPTHATVTVYSAAMRRPISVTVLLPRDRGKPRPTLYLLDGIDAGVYTKYTESGWTYQTDVARFMADKNVNVVLPIGGTGSYYTDWATRDPVLGLNRWETFLTEELPPLLDSRFHGNGVNAIGGLSMGALGAMSLAVRNPELYSGVAAFSGCLDQGSVELRQATAATVATRGGNPDNMWGPLGGTDWAAHDPAANVSALRGKPIYVAVGNGLPDPSLGLAGMASPVGGILEGVVLQCTVSFRRQAERAGVHATYDFRAGLHSWGYWNRDLHRAWPTLATALRVRP
ncbi:esterase family protein [Gordonia sp. SID5947]|uniref:alpha/beta hydrolase n=1 Tax=Gordonia sp. SID5947 TaxID=2690315 RepID=UPI001367CC57|nr:alpha/beta hydrolase family protein [Gordonia sp. SID5947]MYR05768.1 esterase family protein [Gordonia sp. SID5947]